MLPRKPDGNQWPRKMLPGGFDMLAFFTGGCNCQEQDDVQVEPYAETESSVCLVIHLVTQLHHTSGPVYE